jgi:hypothetical protein
MKENDYEKSLSPVVDFVEILRSNPEEWQNLRLRYLAAQTKEDKINLLKDFYTSESELRTLFPADSDIAIMLTPTIGITITIIIITTIPGDTPSPR